MRRWINKRGVTIAVFAAMATNGCGGGDRDRAGSGSEPRSPDSDVDARPLDEDEVAPLGTFCLALDGTESCYESDEFTVTRVANAGVSWFRITADVTITLHDLGGSHPQVRTVHVSGQVADGTALPADADAVVVRMPLVGMCQHQVVISPFGQCGRVEQEVACEPESTTVQTPAMAVLAASTTGVAGSFRGTVPQDTDCCVHAPGCPPTNDPVVLEPAGPFEISGRFHVSF